MGSPATSAQGAGTGMTEKAALSQPWEGASEQTITECTRDKEGQGLMHTLLVFKGDCCPEEKKRKPGTAQLFSLVLFHCFLFTTQAAGSW